METENTPKEIPGFTRQVNDPCWLPDEAGQQLAGVVTAIEEGTYGKQYTLLTKDNEEFKTPSHKVLQNRLTKVEVGSVIIIMYQGVEPPSVKGNNPTKMYQVYVKDPTKQAEL